MAIIVDIIERVEEHSECTRTIRGYISDWGICLHSIGEPADTTKFFHSGNALVSWHVYGTQYWYTEPYCMACEFDKEMTLYWLLKYGDKLPWRINKDGDWL